MDELVNLISTYNPATLLIIIAGCASVCKGLVICVKKIFGFLEGYRKSINKFEDKNKNINEKIKELETSINTLNQKNDELIKSIAELQKTIKKIQETQNRSIVTTTGSTMTRLANEIITKGWMTETDHETLSDLSDVWLKAGGSDNYVIPVVVQRALNLSVLTDDEIERRLNAQQK